MKPIKFILRFAVLFLITLGSVCGIYARIYSPEYIARCLKWGVLKVGEEGDRQAAAHVIRAGNTPFHFSQGSAEEEQNVKQTFAAVFSHASPGFFFVHHRNQSLPRGTG